MPSFLHASRLSATKSGSLRDLILTFLTRPGCHLCDEARPIVLAEAGRIDAVVEEIDIDTDDRLVALYGMRIPVLVTRGDVVLAEGIISLRGLRRKLKSTS